MRVVQALSHVVGGPTVEGCLQRVLESPTLLVRALQTHVSAPIAGDLDGQREAPSQQLHQLAAMREEGSARTRVPGHQLGPHASAVCRTVRTAVALQSWDGALFLCDAGRKTSEGNDT